MSRLIQADRCGSRFNCGNCGSFVPMPTDLSDADNLALECPRCRSMHGITSSSGEVIYFELTAIQNEYQRTAPGVKRTKPKRDAIYADPIYGPIRRAQDRLRRAEIDLAQAMASAHLDAGESIRAIALNAGISKSSAHALIKQTAADYALKRKPQNREVVAAAPAVEWSDDIPF